MKGARTRSDDEKEEIERERGPQLAINPRRAHNAAALRNFHPRARKKATSHVVIAVVIAARIVVNARLLRNDTQRFRRSRDVYGGYRFSGVA